MSIELLLVLIIDSMAGIKPMGESGQPCLVLFAILKGSERSPLRVEAGNPLKKKGLFS